MGKLHIIYKYYGHHGIMGKAGCGIINTFKNSIVFVGKGWTDAYMYLGLPNNSFPSDRYCEICLENFQKWRLSKIKRKVDWRPNFKIPEDDYGI